MLRLFLLLSCSLLVACDDGVSNEGALVGGPCLDSTDCDQRCQTGGDFPQGTCTLACNTDADCPEDTWCVDKEGGICLLACTHPSDCRGGYNCEGVTNRTHGGDSLVCIN